MKIPEELSQRIKTFLKERRESDGGWAPVTDEDMEQFHAVIYALIEAKWGADPDGDRPIDYILIDRTKYRPMDFFPLPYGHRTGKREEEFDNAMTNLSMAMEAIRTTDVMVERHVERSAKIPVKEYKIDQLTEIWNKLDAIIIRCTEGDPRSDWLPVIERLAREAIANIPLKGPQNG
jgi:hypothetical protein